MEFTKVDKDRILLLAYQGIEDAKLMDLQPISHQADHITKATVTVAKLKTGWFSYDWSIEVFTNDATCPEVSVRASSPAKAMLQLDAAIDPKLTIDELIAELMSSVRDDPPRQVCVRVNHGTTVMVTRCHCYLWRAVFVLEDGTIRESEGVSADAALQVLSGKTSRW